MMKVQKERLIQVLRARSRGSSLAESLVVASLIILIACALVGASVNARAAARDARRIGDLNTIRDALVLHHSLFGAYPNFAPNYYDTSINDRWLKELSDKKIISVIPKDPINSADPARGLRSLFVPENALGISTQTEVTPAQGAQGFQYAAYTQRFERFQAVRIADSRIVLCASALETQKKDTLLNGYPNAATAPLLISLGFNPDAYCLILS